MTPRLAAVYALYDTIVEKKSLSVNKQLSCIKNPSDRGLCQELVYGTLRNYPSIRATLNDFLKKPITKKNKALEIILCAAIYQLIKLNQPSYAVINESVSLLNNVGFEWAKGFVNAVLRNIARSKISSLKADSNYDHPVWLVEKIKKTYPKLSEKIFHENHCPAKVMLRVRKGSRDDYILLLNKEGIDSIPHIDNKETVILKTATDITKLPLFTKGWVTVQDANAQLAANLLSIKPGLSVLDACAAPGGKTAHIYDKANSNTYITAVDSSESRIKLLKNTLCRLNIKAKVITSDILDIDSWHDGNLFDCILLDAPCSATGVIRKHPDILFHRTLDDINNLVKTQSKILNACWKVLKPKGRMLYATCSILPEENINQVYNFLSKNKNAQLKPLAHNRSIDKDSGMLQFLPDNNGDGFFYAAVEKKH